MKGKTILVADDETHLTYILSFKLQQDGFEVLTARNGAEALALAIARHPDLIITDLVMPLLNGLELCVRLREHPRTSAIPVLMLTARSHRLSVSELVKTNIQEIITKPFSSRELLAKIHDLLPDVRTGAASVVTQKGPSR